METQKNQKHDDEDDEEDGQDGAMEVVNPPWAGWLLTWDAVHRPAAAGAAVVVAGT